MAKFRKLVVVSKEVNGDHKCSSSSNITVSVRSIGSLERCSENSQSPNFYFRIRLVVIKTERGISDTKNYKFLMLTT